MLGILLAAGKGTRMKSATPKVLFDVNEEPLCFAAFKSLYALCDRVLVVVGYRGEDVKERLLERASEVFGKEAVLAKTFFYTQEEQNGTGHAVKIAVEGIGKGFAAYDAVLVLNGDLPLIRESTLQHMIEEFQKQSLDSLCLSFETQTPFGFGRILRDASGKLMGIREEKDASPSERKITEVNGGVYCFKSGILFDSLQKLKNDNKQNEFYLTDLLGSHKQPQLRSAALLVEDAEDLLGVNTTFELNEVRRIAQRRLQKQLCEEFGVDFANADSCFVSARAKFSGPVKIGPSCSILGNSELGCHVVLEGHVLIRDSKIENEAQVLWSSVVVGSRVGSRSKVGPMAHLRPGTVLSEDVKVGNFVEIKKTTMARGSKASHLSYLGDADVGEESNVGAGTITCNYDGFNKFKTTIGKRAFIGSDSQLVAPVVIGDEAYVGSGTTVTEDVPEGALAISRPDMIIKEGYAQKLAAKRRAQQGNK
jgi:bifunctional UDP-N-acetylglucosamine pyrophosphorylase/glucosamine-1-phosphate N-acetyltransferase